MNDELIPLVKVATYWRLRLRNVVPETGKPLEENDSNFLPSGSEQWLQAEKRFYECIDNIIQFLNSPRALTSPPLEILLPLCALVRIVLDNRHPSGNECVIPESPYYRAKDNPTWQQLDRLWHTLKDDIGRKLDPKIKNWISAPWIKGKISAKHKQELEQEDINQAQFQVWDDLGLSFKGQPTPRGKDSVFNPHYRQQSGQCTVKGWLGTRIYRALEGVAIRKAQEQRLRANDPLDNIKSKPSQAWWEQIREAVEGPCAEELQQIQPRSKALRHINAQLVILNLLPPESVPWEEMAQQWGCDDTTIRRFYNDKCCPWLQKHFSAEDLLSED
ncbi:hypothetical protein MiYa_04208 [Microcystis aeruginosa NIES-2519]|uniref:Uncharacterized protein n=1 Tax=Microcystis aeruginosa NIES-2519 TaxID=2303981 RepID=A0A5A5RCI5_MICAE|nr:hypothetical protein [Microcystis aeruginosa]GCA72655.1 hypothetical protein MiYa_04208 [Microcystis aeruginosa NIES-2519]